MVTGSGGTKKGAKEVLDEFGQQVHKEVKTEAANYVGDLKGDLKKATNRSGETAGTLNPCSSDYTKHFDASGKRYPCTELSGKMFQNPFSDTLGGQCTDSKIKGNKYNRKTRKDCGACAPYRRLHLCDYNLETIETTSTTSDTLLAEVCMAAKHEGDSIKTHYPKYQTTYEGSGFTICTALARSFADIGDIIRGKDLYRGNDKEKDQRKQLDKKLKDIFKNIKKENNSKLTKLNDDQIREYWWALNRQDVWKALTCKADTGNAYFRATCSDSADGNSKSQANNKCTCNNGDVPTYFDYVPQFLRWFDEWAEDFCRLRKHKLQNAKEQCRGKNGKEKYCDLNRYDCTQTASGEKKFVEDDVCKDCQYSCSHFVNWIDNQKLEFLKQKEKYKSEITGGGGRKKRGAGGETATNYDGYESKFYKIFKGQYSDVDNFLEKLNNEEICTKVKDGGTINFKNVQRSSASGDGNNKTFSHTEYCQACPWCGLKDKKDGTWEAKGDGDCKPVMDYTNYVKTEIPILTGDKGQLDIVRKYSKFCNSVNGKNGAPVATPATANGGATGGKGGNGAPATATGKNGDQIETWKCYYDENKDKKYGSGAINFCVLQDDKVRTSKEKSMHYNAFFWKWVYHMLHDSLDWRKELGSCINDAKSGKCRKGCKNPCDCFAKWVEKKQQEWGKIIEHFYKQKDIVQEGGFLGSLMSSPSYVLKTVLNIDELFQNIKDVHGDTDDIKRIRKMLKEEENQVTGVAASGVSGNGDANGQKSIIDKLLKHEGDDATKCKNCQPTKIRNPCSGESGNKLYPVLAEKVAQILQGEAQTQLGQNKSSLLGDIKKAKFKNGASPSSLEDVCGITDQHTNDRRHGTDEYKGPCTGKDGSNGGVRMKIGTPWKLGSQIQMSAEDIYMPPRREHMCTSNLEKLDVGKVTGNSNVNDSFLGDVLLSAKIDAEKIKDLYQQQNDKSELTDENNKATICRAIRYSFADLGDIIRGRDLWENGEAKQLQKDLVTIFRHIHSSLNGKGKYAGDANHTKLRADWWEANRDQVWKSMQCSLNTLKSSTADCKYNSGNSVPLDDYIPQRLRWMKEWAEWFCKEQYSLYDKLFMQCAGCKNKEDGKGCMQNDFECKTCEKACKEYKTKINTWKQQWDAISYKYLILYLQVKNDSDRMAILGTDPDYKQVVHFFKELQKEYENATRSSSTTMVSSTASPITPYSSPEGYIHQELPITGCQKQKEFCEYKNGLTSRSSDAKENKNYAFKNPPHGYDLACTCNTRDQQTDGRGRSETNDTTTAGKGPSSNDDDSNGEESASDAENEDEEEDLGDDAEGDVQEEAEEEEPQQETQPEASPPQPKEVAPKEEVETVKPCQIVQTLFNSGEPKNTFKEACEQKYSGNQSRLGWKCIPTSGGSGVPTTSGDNTTTEPAGRVPRSAGVPDGVTTTSSGSICVPPRRRKLYVTPLTKLTGGNTQSSQPQGDTPSQSGKESSPSGEKLRDAFIQSAAIETFFAWHKYKAENTKRQSGVLPLLQTTLASGSGDDEASTPDPQTQLKNGKIPTEFLRQMFYTLGDYRDICVGVKDDVAQALKSSGDNKSGDKNIKEISEKIKSVIENSGSKRSGQKTTPESWWETYGKDIWEGMICALTYKENGSGGEKKIEKDDAVYKKFFGENNTGKPDNQNGTFKDKYNYNTVTLKEDESGDAKITVSSAKDGPTLLSHFVERPPYFRWLEEWGETFCRKRKRMLKDVRDNCRDGIYGNKNCDGDGFNCDEKPSKKEDIFKPFDCPSCAEECRKYKNWIKKKRTEYEKQQKIYDQQKTKYETESENAKSKSDNTYDQEFVEKLRSVYTSIDLFLNSLKNGPCKTNNDHEKKQDCYIDFSNRNKTFGHENYCDPCPAFGVICNKGDCSNAIEKECKEYGRTDISAEDIKNSTEISMLVSDDNINKSETVLDACKNAHIFKGIRKDVWTCGELCNSHVCVLKKNNNNGTNEKQNLQIRAFFKRWLEYFFDDYNKINAKISHSRKNGKGSKCIKGCVDEWITKKKAEWKTIKERYVDNYEKENEDGNNLNSFLEQGLFYNEVQKAIKPCTEFNDFQKSKKCTETDSSENENGKGSNKKDGVLCLLKKLEKKIDECKRKHDKNSGQTCSPAPPETPDDDEEPLEEDEQNTVGKQQPSFCPPQIPVQPEETEETCDGVAPQPDIKEEEEEKEETNVIPESEDSVDSKPKDDQIPKQEVIPAPKETPSKRKKRQPLQPPDLSEPLKNAMLSNTIMWSIGIGFAAISYFFLKKKTKSSVGNLFQILQIPKSDYDIPTLKSSNRYIPYVSDRYKGKTYIYMEGDESDDYTYIGDISSSDITSSSESEYEEIDINDIYVPGSPKYKTLIEVVLEPSKRDTMNTQSDIPLNDKLDSNKLTDEEWNQLKKDFISKILQNPQMDLPQNNISRDTSINTHPDISILHDSMEEKPFITSIHDRDLHNGDDVTYNINLDDHKNMNFSTNHDNIPPKNNKNDLYTGLDLINDSISGNHNVDIYDELLKRKENELFGTNHTKHTTTNSIAKKTHNDPIVNQINLFHKWLDRHKNMCEQWDKNKKEELLDKLKKEWEQDYKNNSDNIHTSDNNIVNTFNHVFNTDVSIQIDMNDPKPINQFTNMYTNSDNSTMDNILNDLEKHRKPYFYDVNEDDITYFDIDDEETPIGDIYVDHNNVKSNNMDVPNKVHIEMNIVNNKKEIFEEGYPISDIWNILN
ncbi:hypothetical protein PFDG_00284 [Plasmodium falciparum Dd2]|uniref:Erythrocyte membrane protein 1 n=1 Tax=Plasmodium falciparum (isolate Dd2) TaxID=57267 RepID=A0A0L7LW83_PLAF4|nr:hypothetical protein PFDG_00284 [Plasmodium falciparum Dd2]